MSGYIDLALSSDELEKRQVINTPLAEANRYPYGTTFSLEENVLEEIDHADWKVDDLFPFHIMAKIAGINSNESTNGKRKCVTFQITAIKGESETAEDNEDEEYSEGLSTEGGYLKPAS